jgi:hypothetical protein
MKKRFKLFAVVLCLIMVLPTVLASCTGNGTPSVTTDEPGSTESAPDTSTPDTATPDVSPDSSTEDTTDVPPTSDTSDVGGTDKPTSTKEVINVKWTMGLVRSDAATRPGYLYKGSCGYSYSEVISIPTAGTEISYTIKNIAKSALPTDQVFVISAWKSDGSKFVFDENGTNLRGTKYASTIVADISPRGGDLYDLKYSYISSKDNENIRLCIPSNHTSDANAPKYTPQDFRNAMTAFESNPTGKNLYDAIYSAASIYNYLSATDKATVSTEYGTLKSIINDYNSKADSINKDANTAHHDLLGYSISVVSFALYSIVNKKFI